MLLNYGIYKNVQYLYPFPLGNAFKIITMAIILLLCYYYYCGKDKQRVALPDRRLSWVSSLFLFVKIITLEHYQFLNLT